MRRSVGLTQPPPGEPAGLLLVRELDAAGAGLAALTPPCDVSFELIHTRTLAPSPYNVEKIFCNPLRVNTRSGTMTLHPSKGFG